MRIKRILIAGFVCAVAAAAGSGHYAHAQTEAIRSKGNIVLWEGNEAAVYAGDIRYLQDELDRLFAELH